MMKKNISHINFLFILGSAIQCSVCDSEKDGLSCLVKPPPPKECNALFNYCISVSKFSEPEGWFHIASCTEIVNQVSYYMVLGP